MNHRFMIRKTWLLVLCLLYCYPVQAADYNGKLSDLIGDISPEYKKVDYASFVVDDLLRIDDYLRPDDLRGRHIPEIVTSYGPTGGVTGLAKVLYEDKKNPERQMAMYFLQFENSDLCRESLDRVRVSIWKAEYLQVDDVSYYAFDLENGAERMACVKNILIISTGFYPKGENPTGMEKDAINYYANKIVK